MTHRPRPQLVVSQHVFRSGSQDVPPLQSSCAIGHIDFASDMNPVAVVSTQQQMRECSGRGDASHKETVPVSKGAAAALAAESVTHTPVAPTFTGPEFGASVSPSAASMTMSAQ